LNISFNKLYSKGGEHLGVALQHSHQLVELNIGSNGLGKQSEYGPTDTKGVSAIANAIQADCKCLAKVNILGNEIGVVQAQELSRIIQVKETLTTLCGLDGEEVHLDLHKQGLTAGCAVLLVSEIQRNLQQLVSINLSGNDLQEAGIQALCACLLENR
jgi:Ran GTPase-activating protein (RanGAP) involved in mRNA processing and transport